VHEICINCIAETRDGARVLSRIGAKYTWQDGLILGVVGVGMGSGLDWLLMLSLPLVSGFTTLAGTVGIAAIGSASNTPASCKLTCCGLTGGGESTCWGKSSCCGGSFVLDLKTTSDCVVVSA
jgi:hypothetical protein